MILEKKEDDQKVDKNSGRSNKSSRGKYPSKDRC